MKSLILSFVVVLSFIFGFSFVTEKEKEDKLSGEFQVFVNSFKVIESTPVVSEESFRDRKNDSLIEGFQIYTFDFDSNFVKQHYLLKDENGNVDSYDSKSKITNIEVSPDGNFAYLTVQDESLYHSKVKEKMIVFNLYGDPNFPIVSVFWVNGNRMTGTYSVDNNTFDGLMGESDSDKIFYDNN